MNPGIVDYRLLGALLENKITLVYRAVREVDGTPVLLKMLLPGAASPERLALFQREYQLLSELLIPGVPRVLALEPYGASLLMAFEDRGGEPLAFWLKQRRFDVVEGLRLATRLTRIVGHIHDRQIAHLNLNSGSVIWDPVHDTAMVLDFGRASALPEELQPLRNPRLLEGSLAYMAPEQSGRMNRLIDYRADFYSLGVLFYEVFTGVLPFQTADPLEMVHCHLARSPVPPHQRDPRVPAPLGALVMRLLEKNAEDRYQSAAGLGYDLECCLNSWQSAGRIPPFELGAEDCSGRLRPPQKLFGRERERTALLEVFERIVSGGREIVLLGGPPGIGKTALAHELHRPVTGRRGYYLEGKFDPYGEPLPYQAWICALDGWVQEVLNESAPRLERWRRDLLAGVGAQGQVLIQVLPSLAGLLGTQPPVPDLGGIEAQNRLQRLFQCLIKTIARPEHPLVVFLDDLQWADQASLALLAGLLSDKTLAHLLIVAAFRSNELTLDHPFRRVVAELRAQGIRQEELSPQPLTVEQLALLLREALPGAAGATAELAAVLHARTEGNPFFAHQLLRTMYEEGLLHFERERRGWGWDPAAIEARILAEDVLELISRRVRQLPTPSQQLLRLAACVGPRFDLSTLSLVAERSGETVLRDLEPASRQRLILSANTQFRFAHDRVRQAAYALMDESDRRAAHWRIGRSLWRQLPAAEREVRLFEIVQQANQGLPASASPEERAELREWNRQAGIKARASAAYAEALEYFESALRLLEPLPAAGLYGPALELEQEAAEAAYLCGRYERMAHWAAQAHERATSPLEDAQAWAVEIQAYTAQGRLEEAVRHALKALSRLDMALPEEPSEVQIQTQMARTLRRLETLTLEGVARLPPMTSAENLARMRLLGTLGEPAYVAAPHLLPYWAAVFAELCLEHGNTPLSPFAYAAFALALNAVAPGHTALACRLTHLARQLVVPLRAESIQCRVLNIAGCMVLPWTEPLRHSLAVLEEGVASGMETGDYTSGGFNAWNACVYAYFAGEPLDALRQRFARNLEKIEYFRQAFVWSWTASYWLGLQRLWDDTQPESVLAHFDEARWLDQATQANDQTGLCYYHLNQLILGVLLGEGPAAAQHASEARRRLAGIQGTFGVALFHFYDALVALADEAAPIDEARVGEDRERLRVAARDAPMNFQHLCDLVDAEWARRADDPRRAAHAYERAIRGARDEAFLHQEALACERAAGFYLERGLPEVAWGLLRRARETYARWQAWTKVKAMERRHPAAFAGQPAPRPSLPESGVLDLGSVIKAVQAISSNLEWDRLLASLLQIVIENAGAQRGVLLCPHDDRWRVEAYREANGEFVGPPGAATSAAGGQTVSAIVWRVARTHQPVILDDATREGEFAQDSEVVRRAPKSILCVPAIARGEATAILYLENNLATHAFPSERLRVLEMLAAQIAISLENARYFASQRKLNLSLEQEIAQRAQAEQALRESEQRYRVLVEQAPEAILVFDAAQNRFVDANTNAEHLFACSRSELLASAPLRFLRGQPDEAAVVANYWENIERALAGENLLFERTLRDAAGCQKVCEVRLSRLPSATDKLIRASYLDISAQKRLEDQLRQAQKMEAVGQLAGGVAHDFNNILAAALMNLNLIQQEPGLAAEVQTALGELEADLGRAAALTRQLLTFSRRQTACLKTIDLNRVLADLLNLLRRLLGEHIRLEFLPAQPLPPIDADPGMMEQVLTNLCVNARDAMPQGGRLTIATSARDLDSAGAQAHPHARPGRFVCLTVADTGTGMDDATLRRIFEPFFTTKGVGHGTGLGLATVYGIVKQHRGWIEVRSAPGAGTRFAVFLPAATRELSVETPDPLPAAPGGGHETVLLVEDEESVRRMVKRGLERFGYRVVEFSSGAECLDAWGQAHLAADLVVSDMVMPGGVNGLELIERLRRDRPSLKAVLTSGYSLDIAVPGVLEGKSVEMLRKPYSLETLVALARRCLDRP